MAPGRRAIGQKTLFLFHKIGKSLFPDRVESTSTQYFIIHSSSRSTLWGKDAVMTLWALAC